MAYPPFDDPLNSTFTEEERGSLTVIYPGLYEYLDHTEQYHSACGKLYKNGK